ncbi:MAG: MaoC family dehydratase [Nocardioidaceae bacterium]
MPTRTFDGPPASLPLYLRAALPALPVIGLLPGVRHQGEQAPNLTLRRTGVVIDPEHLARYSEVCGFAHTDRLPATYPQVLAFALHVALMTDTAFPFAPLGAVHVANSIRVLTPLHSSDLLEITVTPGNLRPHRRGRLIDILTTVAVDGTVAWEGVTTLLGRGRDTPDAPIDAAAQALDIATPVGQITWRLDPGLGRRYAAASGDRNPIHLYGLTARAFGFPRQIAHGMWTMAHCLAALQGRIPDTYEVAVGFRKPILLPGAVQFGSRADRRDTVIGVTSRGGETTHLIGRVAPLPPAR